MNFEALEDQFMRDLDEINIFTTDPFGEQIEFPDHNETKIDNLGSDEPETRNYWNKMAEEAS